MTWKVHVVGFSVAGNLFTERRESFRKQLEEALNAWEAEGLDIHTVQHLTTASGGRIQQVMVVGKQQQQERNSDRQASNPAGSGTGKTTT